MQVVFTKELEDLYENPSLGDGYYPPGVVKKFIKCVTVMFSVEALKEVNNFGRYDIEQKKGNMKGIRAAKLQDGWRLEFTLTKDGKIQVINLKRISNHYAK